MVGPVLTIISLITIWHMFKLWYTSYLLRTDKLFKALCNQNWEYCWLEALHSYYYLSNNNNSLGASYVRSQRYGVFIVAGGGSVTYYWKGYFLYFHLTKLKKKADRRYLKEQKQKAKQAVMNKLGE